MKRVSTPPSEENEEQQQIDNILRKKLAAKISYHISLTLALFTFICIIFWIMMMNGFVGICLLVFLFMYRETISTKVADYLYNVFPV